MKIWEAIELLSEYEDKEQDIVIGWWDKETVEGYLDDNFQLSQEQWSNIVILVGTNPEGFEHVSEMLADLGLEYWNMLNA